MARVRTDFPHEVRIIENEWITLSDGCKLAARIWLPVDAEDRPVPAIFEFLPYRKDDSKAEVDQLQHGYFAGCGYAGVRVDMRGTGNSEGLIEDEYTQQELDDAVEVIAWIAAQSWCSGAVGMTGISWGGFNALQVAAMRPPALKAIITVCSTDDRYADDVHYMGGCVDMEMLSWASVMLADVATPPYPAVVGGRWREMWLDRIEGMTPWVVPWLTHQRRDDFWKHGSVCEDFDAIECAVYAVGGWADGYTNSIPRLLEGLSCPRKGLIGPWAHTWPELGKPGPAIGFLQEAVRWWDQWLKGEETGIMDEPMLRAWVQDSVPPSSYYDHRPGRWVAEPSWPSPNIERRSLSLNHDALEATPGEEVELTITGQQSTGMDAGVWCPYAQPGDMPTDQRGEDGRSLCFDSAPLDEPLDILGFPDVRLRLAADKPLALVVVRLCDVSPDGASTLVSRGLLNLTHRDNHEFPKELVPGERYEVTVRLNAIGWSVPAGHRLRVAISPTYWPHAWPSPEPVSLSIFTGVGSELLLPVRARRPEDDALPSFGEPETGPPLEIKVLGTGAREYEHRMDVVSGRVETRIHGQKPLQRYVRWGIEYSSSSTDHYSIIEGNPLSASVRCERVMTFANDDWQVRVETVSTMTSDREAFHLINQVEAFEGDVRVATRSWSHRIPRDHV